MLALLLAWHVGHGVPLAAQSLSESNGEIWWDVDLRYRVTPRWTVFSEVSARGWNQVRISPGFEYAANRWLDLLGLVPLIAITGPQGLVSSEVRFSPGVRLTWRTKPWLTLRNRDVVEFRRVHLQASDVTELSTRVRVRFEARAAIAPTTFAARSLLYGIADVEGFLTLGQQLSNQKLLDRTRVRAGLGYRFNRWWTVEGLYLLETRWVTRGDADITTWNHILQMRLVHFIR
jgi:hypothetical protein